MTNYKKEVIDQALHLSIGFLLTVLLSQEFGMPGAGWFVFSLALLREMWQHRTRGIGAGSWRDSAYWFVGCFIGGLV